MWEKVGFRLFDRGRLARLSARYYADCRMRYLLVALTFLLAPLAGQDFERLRERMVREQIEARVRCSAISAHSPQNPVSG